MGSAFLIVMKNKNLGYLREGNVIHIMTMDALKKKQSESRTLLENKNNLHL